MAACRRIADESAPTKKPAWCVGAGFVRDTQHAETHGAERLGAYPTTSRFERSPTTISVIQRTRMSV